MGLPRSPGGTVPALRASFCATDPKISRRLARATILSDHRADLAHVRVPSLLLPCRGDLVAPAEVGAYLHRALAGRTLAQLDATGHCPHVSHPEETVRAIREYLAATR